MNKSLTFGIIGLLVIVAVTGYVGLFSSPDSSIRAAFSADSDLQGEALRTAEISKTSTEDLKGTPCKDTDGGFFIYEKGTATSGGSGIGTQCTDACLTPDTLKECFCDGASVLFDKEPCEFGCSDGACNSAPACEDSDGGDYPDIPGRVDFQDEMYLDSCINADALTEYYCNGNNISTAKNYTCENGCQSNGKMAYCEGGSAPACEDPDGDNINFQGTTTYLENGMNQEYVDECGFDGISVNEGLCNNGNFYVQNIGCQQGVACSNGACEGETGSCYDSDIEDEFPQNSFGYVRVSDDPQINDVCASATSVVENYCSAAGEPLSQTITCDQGFTCQTNPETGLSACVESPCHDTDGGNYIFNPGTVTVNTGNNVDFYPDTCMSNNQIEEFFCSNGAEDSEVQSCPAGKICFTDILSEEGFCVDAGALSCDNSGDGSLENPFEIRTCGELQDIETNLNYELCANIDCSATSEPNWVNALGEQGEGFFVYEYGFSLDGNGFAIDDLYTKRANFFSLHWLDGVGGRFTRMVFNNPVIDFSASQDFDKRAYTGGLFVHPRSIEEVGVINPQFSWVVEDTTYPTSEFFAGTFMGGSDNTLVVRNSYVLGGSLYLDATNKMSGRLGALVGGRNSQYDGKIYLDKSYSTAEISGDISSSYYATFNNNGGGNTYEMVISDVYYDEALGNDIRQSVVDLTTEEFANLNNLNGFSTDIWEVRDGFPRLLVEQN